MQMMDQRLNESNLMPFDEISYIDDVENLAAVVQTEIIKSYEVACPEKVRHKAEYHWWNSDLARLRK